MVHLDLVVGVQGLVSEDVTNLTELAQRRARAVKNLTLPPPWDTDLLQELQKRRKAQLRLFPELFNSSLRKAEAEVRMAANEDRGEREREGRGVGRKAVLVAPLPRELMAALEA